MVIAFYWNLPLIHIPWLVSVCTPFSFSLHIHHHHHRVPFLSSIWCMVDLNCVRPGIVGYQVSGWLMRWSSEQSYKHRNFYRCTESKWRRLVVDKCWTSSLVVLDATADRRYAIKPPRCWRAFPVTASSLHRRNQTNQARVCDKSYSTAPIREQNHVKQLWRPNRMSLCLCAFRIRRQISSVSLGSDVKLSRMIRFLFSS